MSEDLRCDSDFNFTQFSLMLRLKPFVSKGLVELGVSAV